MAAELRAHEPGLEVELVVVSTEGDRRRDVSLAEIGGKGVFVKEVQAAVLDGRADVAVHSAKDLPALTPDGLVVAAVPPRADPRDGLVGSTLDDAGPMGATVATGSRRRAVQLVEVRPDLVIVDLRGNIDTRVARAGDDDVDAVVVAVAALDRLGRSDAIAEVLDPSVMLPQVGQGSLAIECRVDDAATRSRLEVLDDPTSRVSLRRRACVPRAARWRLRPAGRGVRGGRLDRPVADAGGARR